MRLHGKSLADRFVESWAINNPARQAQVRQAVRQEPLRMQRILLLSELLYPAEQRRFLPTIPAEGGATGQALIAQGAAGIEVLEMALMDFFVSVAPRLTFGLEGQTTNPRTTVGILCWLLQQRYELGHSNVVVYNPLKSNLEPVDHLDERLAADIGRALRDAGDIDAASLICAAMADGSALPRRATVFAAVGFVGFARVREALQNAAEDPDELVREQALDALAPLAARPEVGASIECFISDAEPRIRLHALHLVRTSLYEMQPDRLLALTFDPVEEIAQTARAWLQRRETSSLRRRPGGGGRVRPPSR